MVDIYLNERFVGEVENPKDFVREIRDKRRKNKIPSSLNVYYEKNVNEVYLDCTRGRARRPLIIVEEGKSKFTKETRDKLNKNELKWDNLVEQGIIEYLDAAEEENTFVALCEEDITKKHTHLEIDPLIVMGMITSLVPFANYNQASRLNRSSKTQKQALGLYAANYSLRMDTDSNVLYYPQKPVVKSVMHDVINYNKHPGGQNVVMAVLSYRGYNMSDGVIINSASIQRGLGRSTYFRPYSAEELRYSGGLIDEISIPDKDVKGYKSETNYRFLEEDGIISPEIYVKEDDVLIGKTSPPRFLGELEEFSVAASTRRESSVSVKTAEKGIVDMVVVTENGEGNRLVQVRLREQRIPEVGDKFASRQGGQKGVIGGIIPVADIPFSASGIVPDIIFSPHSIPSRMAISHLLELLAGKVGALSGRYVNGTSFNCENEEDLRRELLSLGFREDGTETFYNGITGEQFEAKIYVGNIYYMKLKHMVANHLHARASGRIQLLTRQPIEGRSRGGGLRLGEMEKDCLVAYGASLLLKERFDSDKVVVYVCEGCGMLAISDRRRKKSFCPKCGGNVAITPIELSYAFKLLLDELKSMGVIPRLNLGSKY